jgi:Outer membrane protein beta-barrel domain
MRVGLPFAVAAVVLVSVAPARAQERDGFWFGFGAGYGSARVDCDTCDDDNREGSLVGFVKLGGTLSRRLLLGAEVNAWTDSQDDARVTLGNLSATLTIYPGARSGFFFKVGAGLSYVDTNVRQGSLDVSVSETGFGFVTGVGWDLRIGDNLSLTPCVNFNYGWPGDIVLDRVVVLPGFRQGVVDFALGLTFH